MANQAFSEASDLMVGAGSVFFRRFDDSNQLHFLGNVSEFNLTTDVTTVEKYSSMNKKRELMASVTTQTQASGSLVLNEYNMYNLALGLYGIENVHQQSATNLVNVVQTVPSVPGIVELRDANGNRYYNISNVSVGPIGYIPPSVTPASITNAGNGTITPNVAGYTGTANTNIYFKFIQSPTNAGDLDGLEVRLASTVLGLSSAAAVTVIATAGSTTLRATIFGIDIDFTVGPNDTFTTSTLPYDGVFNITAGVTAYEEYKDYVADEVDRRAGLIRITKNSRITEGNTIVVNADVPGEEFITVSGAVAGRIEGELLFIGDPNQGNAMTIEAWKCSIKPDGDLTGLISEDFGEFTLSFNVMSDYENHPDYPLYKVTKVAETTYDANKYGVYDPIE